MADNKKNDGTSDEFEDINFEDFTVEDFDEAQAEEEAELSDLPEEDFSDENFADEDWQDDEDDDGSQVDQNLLTDGGKKGLSFNTIVMIGAFVVGAGVLAVNIISKSGQGQGGGGIFQSMLDISGVMDGDFFGSPEAEKTPEEIAAQEAQTQNEGFLNNPDVVIPSDATTPPQPTPIAPPEEAATDNQPLTPMPDSAQAPVTPSAETPRGPEEGAPESNVAIAELPAEAQTPPASTTEETPTETPSAEDILKKAMENREQKGGEPPVDVAEAPAPETPAEVPPEVEAPAAPVEPEPVAEVPAPETPAPVPAAPAVSAEEVAENAKVLEDLDGRLEQVLKRMDQIESDMGSVKDAATQKPDTQALEETIESLKAEIAELKNRPAAPAEKPAKSKPVPLEEPTAAEEPAEEPVEEAAEAPKPAPKKASKPKTPKKAASAPAADTGRWELRAAQPGRAWVSKPGERDMQSVEVGQSLTGIGRVTAILYQNGRWTVQGTSGQINQ